MRLEALAVLVLTSSLGVAATRPRVPSSPPFSVSSELGNSSSYGLTGTRPVYIPTGYGSSSSPQYKPTGYNGSTGAILKPTGNSTGPARSKCSGETLNVLDASLDWWYTRTLYHVVSTISVQFNRNESTTGWTVLPATTPFDLASAMASPTCESSLTWNTIFNMSLWDVSCTPAPTPVAASTTVITQTAFKNLNETTGSGHPPNVVKTPPPVTITIPSSGGTYVQGTPFVYFSAYEIVTKSQSTYGNGTVGCAEATQTFQMAEPFSFEYTDGEVNGTKEVGAGVTGDVNPAFLQVVGQSAAAGSWVAAPTVVVVVQDIYAAEAVLAAKAGPMLTMTTETILQTPEPTLPPGFTTGNPDTEFPSIGFTGHVESTAPSLAVPTHIQKTKPGIPKPTKSHPGGPKPTNPGSGPPEVTTGPDGRPTPVTTPRNGPSPTNTEVPTNRIISAILSAVTPTNALQVLQQAQDSVTSTENPTVAAIIDGITPESNTRIGTGPDGKPTLIIGGTTFTPNARTEFVVGTATLTPGGTVVNPGTTVSLASGLTAVVVNGQTHTASPALITPAPVLGIGGTTYSPAGGSASGPLGGPTYVIQGQTLVPGGVITIDGTTVSLALGGSSVVVNGVTQGVGSASPASITAAPVLTIGGETFTAINNGFTYDIDGETLTPGGIETVTVDGKVYIVSLGIGATILEIETVGPNGVVTATTYETLSAGSGPASTVTSVVGASSGSRPSSGPSHSVAPALANGAANLKIKFSAFYVFLTSLMSAILL